MDKAPTLRVLYTVGVLAGSLALLGCPKRPEVAQAGPGAIGPSAAAAPAAKPASRAPEVPVTRETPLRRSPESYGPAEMAVKPGPALASAAAAPLMDIFFPFDDATIRNDQKTALNADFEWLKAHPGVKVRIEGNCDERGTAEYNLALGERRVEAVQTYLMAEGIAASRISTISYGKDRPFVLGHDESAWKWNRRDHLLVTQ